MATYKKRGYKPKTKAEKETKIEEGSATAEVFKSLDEGASKTEAWMEKNQKYILGLVAVVAIGVLGYLGYQEFIQKPKQIEAANEMAQAQFYYDQALTSTTAKDSLFSLALSGGAGKYGFTDIADKFSGTDAGNLASYYAGMSYLNTKKYQEAINYLDDFKSSDEMLGPLAKGAIGDAFVQLGQKEEALKYYEEAATMKANGVTAPRFLLKAGILALDLGNVEKAKTHLKNVTENYETSPEAAKAKLYLGRAEAMN